MSAVESELRTAIADGLAQDAAVRAALGDPVRLHVRRPRDAAYPHASWGRVESLNRDADGAALTELRLTLDVWCRDADPSRVLGVLRQALRRLDINLPEPVRLLSLVPAYTDIFQTRHPRIQRGLIRLRALVAETLETEPSS